MIIKPILIAACLALPFAAFAQDKPKTAQQEKMTVCNKQAADKKLEGDARKKFMSECLSAKPEAAKAEERKLTPQQEKMGTCNKEASAKNLKGEERNKFMSECLKKK